MTGSRRGQITPYKALVNRGQQPPAPRPDIKTVFHKRDEIVDQIHHTLTDTNGINHDDIRRQRQLEHMNSVDMNSFLSSAGKRLEEEKKEKAKQETERKEKKEAEDKIREQEMLIKARHDRDALLARMKPEHPLIQPDAAPASSQLTINVVTPSSVDAASSEPRPHPYSKLVINTASPTPQTFEVQSPKPEKAPWCPKLSACMGSISSTLFSCFNSSSSGGVLDDDYELMNPPNSPGNR